MVSKADLTPETLAIPHQLPNFTLEKTSLDVATPTTPTAPKPPLNSPTMSFSRSPSNDSNGSDINTASTSPQVLPHRNLKVNCNVNSSCSTRYPRRLRHFLSVLKRVISTHTGKIRVTSTQNGSWKLDTLGPDLETEIMETATRVASLFSSRFDEQSFSYSEDMLGNLEASERQADSRRSTPSFYRDESVSPSTDSTDSTTPVQSRGRRRRSIPNFRVFSHPRNTLSSTEKTPRGTSASRSNSGNGMFSNTLSKTKHPQHSTSRPVSSASKRRLSEDSALETTTHNSERNNTCSDLSEPSREHLPAYSLDSSNHSPLPSSTSSGEKSREHSPTSSLSSLKHTAVSSPLQSWQSKTPQRVSSPFNSPPLPNLQLPNSHIDNEWGTIIHTSINHRVKKALKHFFRFSPQAYGLPWLSLAMKEGIYIGIRDVLEKDAYWELCEGDVKGFIVPGMEEVVGMIWRAVEELSCGSERYSTPFAHANDAENDGDGDSVDGKEGKGNESAEDEDPSISSLDVPHGSPLSIQHQAPISTPHTLQGTPDSSLTTQEPYQGLSHYDSDSEND